MLYGRTSSNLPSRFTEEIPAHLVERRGVARRDRQEDPFLAFGSSEGYGFSERNYSGSYGNSTTYGTRSSGYGEMSRPRPAAPARRPAAPAPRPKATLSAPTVPDFKVGDKVEHKSFGPGVIQKLTPMGGDALVEIEFEKNGSKKLMLRVAGQHMTKV
jgi:DNA helicase-2/ATP-dependent DNA helicase PcrA